MFLAPNFFWGEAPPEFLEWDYKIRPDSDHVAKFQGDRASGTAVPGGLIIIAALNVNVRKIQRAKEANIAIYDDPTLL